MAKRKRINLIEWATTVPVKVGRHTPILLGWSLDGTTSGDVVSLGDFERRVIDSIINWTDWKPCPASNLLHSYFKNGNDLTERQYFVDNLLKIAKSRDKNELFYEYAKWVRKSRYDVSVEDSVLPELWKDWRGTRAAYKYAKYVVRGKLSESSTVNCKSFNYVKFLQSKGLGVEEILITNPTLSFYFYKHEGFLPENVHNMMIASHLSGDRAARVYFKQRKYDDRLIKNRLRMVDPNKTVKELLSDM